jgi:ketosteroid isomerase-like protein
MESVSRHGTASRLSTRYCEAMSQQNVEIVLGMVHDWANGKRELARAAFDSHVVAIFPFIDGRVTHGIAEMERSLESWRRTWADWQIELGESIDAGDHVVVEFVQRGSGRESGVEVELVNGAVVSLRNGKIIRYEVFETKREALEAAGLQE